MTLIAEQATAAHWTEPEGIAPRGTLILIPGRGESPELYERFGRRISGDGYRVHAVADPVADPALATSQVLAVAAEVRPCVLVGSDTGALFAAGLVASGRVTEADAAGAGRIACRPSAADRLRAERLLRRVPVGSWEAELEARTACPLIAGGWQVRGCAGARSTSPSPVAGIARGPGADRAASARPARGGRPGQPAGRRA